MCQSKLTEQSSRHTGVHQIAENVTSTNGSNSYAGGTKEGRAAETEDAAVGGHGSVEVEERP